MLGPLGGLTALDLMATIFLSVSASILSMNSVPLEIIVYMISMSVLYIATIARLFLNLLTRLRHFLFIRSEYFTTLCAEFTSMDRSIDGPCFAICPLISDNPDWSCLGTRPPAFTPVSFSHSFLIAGNSFFILSLRR